MLNFLKNAFRKKESTLKMYVLVRKDLDETYRNVQGSHATIEFILRNVLRPELSEWRNNPYLIHLGVRFPHGLYSWKDKLDEAKIPYCSWREPDLDNQTTAIACLSTGEIFKDLNLA